MLEYIHQVYLRMQVFLLSEFYFLKQNKRGGYYWKKNDFLGFIVFPFDSTGC